MSRPLLLLLAVAALAGCAAPEAPPATLPGPTGDPGIEPDETRVDEGTVQASYRFGLDTLAFEGGLASFLLVPDGNVTFSFGGQISIPTTRDGSSTCTVGRVAMQAAAGNASAVAVGWSTDASVYLEASAAGTPVVVLPHAERGGGFLPVEATLRAQGTLRPGDSLLLQFGGTSHAWLSQDGGAIEADLDVTGPARLLPVPPTPVACGVGVRGAGGTASFAGYAATGTVGGRLAATTGNESTMLVAGYDTVAAGDGNRATVRFLDEPAQPLTLPFVAHSPAPGTMAIELERWTDAFGGLRWLFADGDWPEVEDIEEG